MLVKAKKEVSLVADKVDILIGLVEVLLNLNIMLTDTTIALSTLIGCSTKTFSISQIVAIERVITLTIETTFVSLAKPTITLESQLFLSATPFTLAIDLTLTQGCSQTLLEVSNNLL